MFRPISGGNIDKLAGGTTVQIAFDLFRKGFFSIRKEFASLWSDISCLS